MKRKYREPQPGVWSQGSGLMLPYLAWPTEECENATFQLGFSCSHEVIFEKVQRKRRKTVQLSGCLICAHRSREFTIFFKTPNSVCACPSHFGSPEQEAHIPGAYIFKINPSCEEKQLNVFSTLGSIPCSGTSHVCRTPQPTGLRSAYSPSGLPRLRCTHWLILERRVSPKKF